MYNVQLLLCNLYIEVGDEELLMCEWVVGGVVKIPIETDIDKWELYYINGKFGFIVY